MADKRKCAIDDEEKIFIESKILMEELKQAATLQCDNIAVKLEAIEVNKA